MSRPVLGMDVLELAREMTRYAKTVDELRQAQAVVLPLAFGLSVKETAEAIGQSVGWTSQLRNRFLAAETVGDGQRERPGGRRHENLTAAREREILEPFLERARRGDNKKAPFGAFYFLAEWTGLEPATPGVTGRYSNQLNYHSNEQECCLHIIFNLLQTRKTTGGC